MKYVFMTGGVISSLGKGLAVASLGTLLERRGMRLSFQKLDPYLNADPGTMNPLQHGEVYVLDDGSETDLDLGHYERFTESILTQRNNLTSGQIYATVLSKERSGEYLGKTVQVIPHITDEIKKIFYQEAEKSETDILITEIGGTTGDIEGLPFLEAIRQFILEVGKKNAILLHMTLVPFIKSTGELKTKPTQQSVAKLREIGLQPDILICRTEYPLEKDVREKLSLYCNVHINMVIEARDVKQSIYELPLMLKAENLDQQVCQLLDIDLPSAEMSSWSKMLNGILHPETSITLGIVGKYTELRDAYKSIYESLCHAGGMHNCEIKLAIVDSEKLVPDSVEQYLGHTDGILVPGGFGDRGTEGKILSTKFARENNIPYFGICLGMQIACIEYARNIVGLKNANSTEFDPQTPTPIIVLMNEQKKITKMGSSMRRGSYQIELDLTSKVFSIYQKKEIRERHRHRYEFNNEYRCLLEKSGMVMAGISTDKNLVEIIELKNHPWFIAVQFHPEFLSKPDKPHPIFSSFVKTCMENNKNMVFKN